MLRFEPERSEYITSIIRELSIRQLAGDVASWASFFHGAPMLYLIVKALLSGVIIVAVSEIAKRSPGLGALVASLPLVSVLGMMWLWRDTHDRVRMAAHSGATFWFVLPSLPMFLAIPMMLDRGVPFWLALGLGCLLTIALYLLMTWIGPRFGLNI